MRLSQGVRQLAADVLDPETASGEEIREQLLSMARQALIDGLDLRDQDKHYADNLLAQGCREIGVGWRDGKVQAYLEYRTGTAAPLVPNYCGGLGEVLARINEALEKVGVDLVDRELYAVMEDEVIARVEVVSRLVETINEAAKLATLLEPLERQQVEGLKVALVPLVGALKSAGNTGELLALLRQLASHDAQ